MNVNRLGAMNKQVGYIDILADAAGYETHMAVLVTRHRYRPRHVGSLLQLLGGDERANSDRMRRLKWVEISVPLHHLEKSSEGLAAILRNKNIEKCGQTARPIKKIFLPEADTFAVVVVLLWICGKDGHIRSWEMEQKWKPCYDRHCIADASKITTFIDMYFFGNDDLRRKVWMLIPYDNTVTAASGHRMPGTGPWLRLLSSALVVERTIRLVDGNDCSILPGLAERYIKDCIPGKQQELLPFPGGVKDKLDKIWVDWMARIKTALVSVSNSISEKSTREGDEHWECNSKIQESFEASVGMSGCFDADLLGVNENVTLSEALEALSELRIFGICRQPSACASQRSSYVQHFQHLQRIRFVWRTGPTYNGVLGERNPVLLAGPPPLNSV